MFVPLFVLSLVFPTILQPIKIALLAAVVGFLLFSRELWTAKFSKEQLAFDLWAVLYAVLGLVWAVGGLLRGNPGATSMLTVHVAYPLVAILLWRLAYPGDLGRLSSVLIISTGLVVATQALFIASFFDLDSGVFFRLALGMLDEETAIVDSTDEYLVFALPNVSTLLFMAPWLAVHAALSHRYRLSSCLLFLLTVGSLLLAGRRASLLSLIAGLAVAIYIVSGSSWGGRAATATFRRRLLLLVLGLVVFLTTAFLFQALSTELLGERLRSIFDFSTNESNILRRLQFDALMAGIMERPMLGHGLGAAAAYSRSDEQPWAYELSYVAVAYNFGLLGFALFAVGVSFILLWSFHLTRSQGVLESDRLGMTCFLVGLTAFLIANATNPYLAKFDYMWTLFVPLAFLRLYVHAPLGLAHHVSGIGTNARAI